METYRQGLGQRRPITASLPTTRTDGTPYQHGPEDYFLFYITQNIDLITDPARFAELVADSPPIAAELVNGTFDNDLDIDGTQPGIWHITYSTVDVVTPGDPTTGLEGPVNPNPLTIEILLPLAPPLYPDAIG